MNLDIVEKALDAALLFDAYDPLDAALRAANAMPATASDFDRGIAAGMALARFLARGEDNLAAA